jgi:hypothetical protein
VPLFHEACIVNLACQNKSLWVIFINTTIKLNVKVYLECLRFKSPPWTDCCD